MTTDNKDGDQHLGVVKGSGSPRLYYQGIVGPTTSPHTHTLIRHHPTPPAPSHPALSHPAHGGAQPGAPLCRR